MVQYTASHEVPIMIHTTRLILRDISHTDRDFLFSQFSSDTVNRYLFDAEPLTCVDEADDIIAYYTSDPHSRHRWIITLHDVPVGTCGYHNYVNDSVEIGYDLAPAHHGNGYATEALSAILPVIADTLGVSHIHAHIYPDNAASVAVATRLGFTYRGDDVTYTLRSTPYIHHIYTLDL